MNKYVIISYFCSDEFSGEKVIPVYSSCEDIDSFKEEFNEVLQLGQENGDNAIVFCDKEFKVPIKNQFSSPVEDFDVYTLNDWFDCYEGF